MSEEEVRDVLNTLSQGESVLDAKKTSRAVLMLGEPSGGKSTLTHFITGDDNLTSKETRSGTRILKLRERDDSFGSGTSSIYPQKVIDTEDGTVFYDLPDFRDDKTAGEEMASSYFTQKVTSRVESVKLVFVVSETFLSLGNIGDIQKFFTHATRLIKNIEKFNDSLALVVTQVDDVSSKENILSNIQSLRGQLTSKAISRLLDILIENSEERIALVKKNQTAASKRSEIEGKREELRKIIWKNLEFVEVNEKDYGYDLTDSIQPLLPSLVQVINKGIANDFVDIGKQLINFYQETENQSRDIDNLHLLFWNASQDVGQFLNLGALYPRDFIERIIQIMNTMKIVIPNQYLTSVLRFDHYLQFINKISNQEMTDVPLERSSVFFELVTYLNNSQKWYDILYNLQNNDLSSYRIQSNVAYYKELAEPLVELRKGFMDSTTLNKVLPERMAQVMRDLGLSEGTISAMTEDVKVDRRKAELLFELINITMENQSLRLCEKNKLVIKGQFVKMSDIGECNVPEVELFATRKVFLDADFDKRGKEVQLTIIAPVWEVILGEGKERKIILDGKDETTKAFKETAESIGAGSAGRVGRHGGPGGPAGDFIGIGQEIIEGKQLIISANGGKGGAGQDGGDGLPGKDGAPPNTSIMDSQKKDQWQKDDNEYVCNDINGGYIIANQWCTVHGKSGGSGGNGGDGGRGGFGGKEGYVKAVFLNYGIKDVNITNNSGEEGDPGNGGTGGALGKKGGVKSLRVVTNGVGDDVYSPKVKAQDGEQGTDGKSGKQREDSDNRKSPSRSSEYPRASLKINAYKDFLRGNLDHSLATSENFLKKLETSKEIIQLYDTIGLVGDMQSLENRFHDLEDKSSFLPYYENLLKRIDEYSQNLPPNEKDYEHKVVLGFLRSSTMNKIRDISFTPNNVLVINPKEYLKSVMENIIMPLLELKEAFRNNETRKDFLEPIESRINEAENTVENVIGPEINQLINNTNEEINNLIRETLELQQKKEDEEKALIKKKQELGGQLALKAILGTVQIASQFLALAGPVGAVAGAAIGGSSSLAQGLLDTSGSPNLTQVPAGVTKSLTSITNRLKENHEVFKQQLSDAEIMLNTLQSNDEDNNIAEIKTKIKTTKQTLDEEMTAGKFDDPESVDKMYSMRKDLDDLLTKKKKILQKEQATSGQKTDQRLRYISKVQNLVDLGGAGIDFYNKISKDMQAIDDVDESIKKAREQRSQLEEYERNIYRTMLPMIKDIQSSFNNLQSTSAGNSHVALDVSKWQIQSNFMDTKKKLKEMTEGYESQGELSLLMDKVEMGMTTVVQIYDRIQDYKDKADLANFIAAISSSGGNRIEDVALFDFLQMNILFNSLLTEYEKSLKAIKLSTFPFINRYINTNDDECEFKFEDNANSIREFTVIGHTVKCIKNKFSSILKEFESDDNVLTSISQKIYRSTVYDSENYQKPFFTKAFDKNDELVNKLLEGQQVEFNADVTAYQVIHEEQHAVKFNSIGINLQISDPTENAELKGVLDGFKVEMTHSGESRYRCSDRFYEINHEKVVISHSANNYTDPTSENEDSFRVRTGAAILSPYTSWKIQLVPKRGVSFDRLKKFKASPMKLHLEGQGWYISQKSVEESEICKDNLGLYYREVARLEESTNSQAKGEFKGMTLDEVDIRRRRRNVDQDEIGELAANATVIKKYVRISTATLQSLSGGGMGRRKRSVGEIDGSPSFNVQNSTKIEGSRKISEGTPRLTHFPDWLKATSHQLPTISGHAIKASTIDETPSATDRINYNAANVASNLLLWDLLVRKPNLEKRKKRSHLVQVQKDLAHNLAYRAHVPRD